MEYFEDDRLFYWTRPVRIEYNQECTVIDMMKDTEFDKESKTNELQKGLNP